MNPIYYFVIAIPLILVIILILYNIHSMKKSRDKAFSKKNNKK